MRLTITVALMMLVLACTTSAPTTVAPEPSMSPALQEVSDFMVSVWADEEARLHRFVEMDEELFTVTDRSLPLPLIFIPPRDLEGVIKIASSPQRIWRHPPPSGWSHERIYETALKRMTSEDIAFKDRQNWWEDEAHFIRQHVHFWEAREGGEGEAARWRGLLQDVEEVVATWKDNRSQLEIVIDNYAQGRSTTPAMAQAPTAAPTAPATTHTPTAARTALATTETLSSCDALEALARSSANWAEGPIVRNNRLVMKGTLTEPPGERGPLASGFQLWHATSGSKPDGWLEDRLSLLEFLETQGNSTLGETELREIEAEWRASALVPGRYHLRTIVAPQYRTRLEQVAIEAPLLLHRYIFAGYWNVAGRSFHIEVPLPPELVGLTPLAIIVTGRITHLDQNPLVAQCIDRGQ